MKKYLLLLPFLFPLGALATSTIPWQQINLTDTFISPSLVNGLTQGLLIKASSTLQNFTFINATGTAATTSKFAISSISSGNCLHTTTGGAIVGTGSDCGSGGGSAASTTLLGDNNAFTGLNTFTDLKLVTRSTTTNATTTSLAISAVTSKLLVTDGNGTVGGYAGTTCTNQFVRILSGLGSATCATVGASDVSLANLTATDGTLTFSGTYTGATARTIGLNLSNANTWTGGQIFANSTTTNATSTTLYVSGASDGVDVTNSYTGRISPTRSFVLSSGTTTTWTASTTGTGYSPFLVMPFAGVVKDVRCLTDASFLGVNVKINGSDAAPSYFVASTTVGKINFSGGTFSAGQSILGNFGTTTTASTQAISCTFDVIENP